MAKRMLPMNNELPKGAVWRAIVLAIASTVGSISAAWLIWMLVRALK
jgi:hypothetical protein